MKLAHGIDRRIVGGACIGVLPAVHVRGTHLPRKSIGREGQAPSFLDTPPWVQSRHDCQQRTVKKSAAWEQHPY